MAIDKTKRPLKIPPQFQLYAEEHGLFDLYHRMLERLVIDKPDDPLEYMLNWLRRESDPVPKIAVIGAPSSGKHTVSEKLSSKLGTVLVKPSSMATSDEEIIADLKERLTAPGSEPVRRGYILNNIPASKKQALLLQQAGIHPNHIISLEASDDILLARRMGKFSDPETGQIYHNVFNWPNDETVRERLVRSEKADKDVFKQDMQYWSREKVGIYDAYKNSSNIFPVNCDQPQIDVVNQAMAIARQPVRSQAIRIPRVVILGPTGSGKATLANYLGQKYKMCIVDADAWIKIVASDKSSSIGDAVREFQSESQEGEPLPDDLMVRCIAERLSRMDCQTKGWILHGFPKNYAQAESIGMLGHRPNRVFLLELPLAGAIERLENRRVDPLTGNRYHLLWNAAENNEISERLLKAPYDDASIIHDSYQAYAATIKQLVQVYIEMEAQLEKPSGGILVRINADQDLQTVAEYGESMLINPVPLNSTN